MNSSRDRFQNAKRSDRSCTSSVKKRRIHALRFL
jgi:hypothetical protein